MANAMNKPENKDVVGRCGNELPMSRNIREHMEVIGSCGNHLGTVDHVEGNSIKLTKDDPKAGGKHHWIPMDWVESVESVVRLNKDCGQAMREWKTEGAGMGA
ncbi:MAG TPA: DUF2171 domain-containing protein [Gemmataceae bacterium]|nr:DUF2171 domain-containing protein [Gemmataceae bacterium]